ncbi:hypothetical protein HRbin27_00745 [bacterium HR27]|nr:hypothetical protein HRbin27_00745 [bacterium HR27]
MEGTRVFPGVSERYRSPGSVNEASEAAVDRDAVTDLCLRVGAASPGDPQQRGIVPVGFEVDQSIVAEVRPQYAFDVGEQFRRRLSSGDVLGDGEKGAKLLVGLLELGMCSDALDDGGNVPDQDRQRARLLVQDLSR